MKHCSWMTFVSLASGTVEIAYHVVPKKVHKYLKEVANFLKNREFHTFISSLLLHSVIIFAQLQVMRP